MHIDTCAHATNQFIHILYLKKNYVIAHKCVIQCNKMYYGTGDFGDDGGFLFTGHDAPNKPAAASQPSRRTAQDAKWAENFESLVETGRSS